MKQKLLYEQYYDRVFAGWLGKSLGGVVGAPFECHKQFNHVPYDKIWPDKLWPNDDLDIQVVWQEALQEIGLDLTSADLAKIWQERCFYVCCEYGVFIDNLEHGINPPLSGSWNNDWFQSSEGCPIRSEIWGFISPGNPELAMSYAAKDGCLDHTRYSIEMERFLSAAASLAFFENSVETLLDRTCTLFPEDHPAVLLYRDIRKICAAYPNDYDAWLQIVRRYGHRDSTRASINNAFAFMALILGKNDFKETMRLCIQAGWDCDCTAATSGALLGALFGTKALPADWLEKLGKDLVCAVEIKHQFQPLREFAFDTCKIGIEMSKVKNPAVEFIGAPEVPVRALRPLRPVITAEYPETPELRHGKATNVRLTVSNPTTETLRGKLTVTAPENLICTQNETELEVLPGAKISVDLQISLAPGAVMSGQNLLKAAFCGVEYVFGVVGTARFLAYGPYWDMWDKDAFEICPYQNEKLTCNPGNLPEFAADAMNTHVRPAFSYLDEKHLARESLPEEQPLEFETARRSLSNLDFSGFTGTCCWYVETTIRSRHPAEVSLQASADCPFECIFDGEKIGSCSSHYTANLISQKVKLTGEKQRLILKFSSSMDSFHFGYAFYKLESTKKRAISPFFSDLEYF